MNHRLDTFARVAALREHRASRERVQANAAAELRERVLREAQAAHEKSVRARAKAEALLVEHAADPQAQAWLAISRRRANAACEAAGEARDLSLEARGEADAARQRHERAAERERQCGFMLAGARRERRQRQDAAIEEDSAEARR